MLVIRRKMSTEYLHTWCQYVRDVVQHPPGVQDPPSMCGIKSVAIRYQILCPVSCHTILPPPPSSVVSVATLSGMFGMLLLLLTSRHVSWSDKAEIFAHCVCIIIATWKNIWEKLTKIHDTYLVLGSRGCSVVDWQILEWLHMCRNVLHGLSVIFYQILRVLFTLPQPWQMWHGGHRPPWTLVSGWLTEVTTERIHRQWSQLQQCHSHVLCTLVTFHINTSQCWSKTLFYEGKY